MRKVLELFKRETLIEFICQRFRLNKDEAMRDLLLIEWELQTSAAAKMMADAIASIQKAKTVKQRLAAELEFERAQKAYNRSERTYKKLEALRTK